MSPSTSEDRARDLPPYVGPEEPAAGHVHEWGAALADLPEDGPLTGPALAPYPSVADSASPTTDVARARDPARSGRGRRPRRPAPRTVRLAIFTAALAALTGAAGILAYARPQPLLPEADAALVSDHEVAVSVVGADLVFRPTGARPTVGLVLYPGAKVPPAAYAPAARRIAAGSGSLVTIVDVPLGFAVFDIDAANRAIAREPAIRKWAVGGHSLGGAMAAQYAATHPGAVRGLVLWASYSATDLSESGLAVLSIYGSLDAGRSRIRADDSLANLPTGAEYVEIGGGNHEQMGWYTGQPDDPPATISRVEQQDQVAAATIRFLVGLGTMAGG